MPHRGSDTLGQASTFFAQPLSSPRGLPPCAILNLSAPSCGTFLPLLSDPIKTRLPGFMASHGKASMLGGDEGCSQTRDAPRQDFPCKVYQQNVEGLQIRLPRTNTVESPGQALKDANKQAVGGGGNQSPHLLASQYCTTAPTFIIKTKRLIYDLSKI